MFFALVAGILLAMIRFVPFTPEVFGALNTAVLAGAGLATAATVSAERALPALVGLVQAVFAVFLAYGSPVPESTQTGILALIAAASAFFVRQNVYPRLDSDGDTFKDHLNAAYDNGYRAGQDDAVPTFTAKDTLSHLRAEAGMQEGSGGTPERVRFEETGTRGQTEVMPAVGNLHEEGNRDQH